MPSVNRNRRGKDREGRLCTVLLTPSTTSIKVLYQTRRRVDYRKQGPRVVVYRPNREQVRRPTTVTMGMARDPATSNVTRGVICDPQTSSMDLFFVCVSFRKINLNTVVSDLYEKQVVTLVVPHNQYWQYPGRTTTTTSTVRVCTRETCEGPGVSH